MPPDAEEKVEIVEAAAPVVVVAPTPEFVINPPEPEAKASGRQPLMARLASMLAGIGGPTATPPVTTAHALAVVKQTDGRLRWFARYSNAWLDKDQEILTEEAHKDYVSWAYETGTFPELWLWHTGGTRFGEADWLDFSDGFAHASGLIDNGKESVVESLSTKDIGVSHGFLSLQQGKYVRRYRTYEISVLPKERAAVETSGFNVLDASKESELMAFTEEKRKWLAAAIGDEAVATLEKSTESMAAQLKTLGVEYKEAETVEAAATAANDERIKAIGEQVVTLTDTVAKLVDVVAATKATADAAQTAAAKSQDEAIEDAYIAKVAKAFGAAGIVRPTESAANVQEGGVKSASAADANEGSAFLASMFAKQFGQAMQSAPVSTVGTPATGAVTVSGSDGVQEVRD